MTDKSTKQGYLYKKGKINKSWQKRWCILNKDSKLYYHRTPNEKYSGYIQLSQTIIRNSESLEREYIFEIITGDRIYLFSADSRNELEDWMKKLFTHSIVQQENDLIERAEFIIKEEALKKSNKEDEFLKLKHSIFDQQINNSNNNNNNQRYSISNNDTTIIGSHNSISSISDSSINSGSIRSSIGSHSFLSSNGSYSTSSNKSQIVLGSNGSKQQQNQHMSITLAPGLLKQTQVHNPNYYHHPLDLIITPQPQQQQQIQTPTSTSIPTYRSNSFSSSMSSTTTISSTSLPSSPTSQSNNSTSSVLK